MKYLGIAYFTGRGEKIADTLAASFESEYYIIRREGDLKVWCRDLFLEGAEGIIFIGACGIAVRTIAPYLRDKTSDPAVLVIDEAGEYVISLLSGHIGGANNLARRAAFFLGAAPVITTATDVNNKFAADVFAVENSLLIDDMKASKKISAAILRGERVGIYCEKNTEGNIPPELIPVEKNAEDKNLYALIYIGSSRPESVFETGFLPPVILRLRPKSFILGIGCKKGKTEQEIAAAADCILKEGSCEEEIIAAQITGVASADLKKEEQGLLEFCRKLNLEFKTYPAKELSEIEGDFSASEFVLRVTGVDNICERAAMCMAGKGGKLIRKKMAVNGVTVAVAERNWSVRFGE